MDLSRAVRTWAGWPGLVLGLLLLAILAPVQAKPVATDAQLLEMARQHLQEPLRQALSQRPVATLSRPTWQSLLALSLMRRDLPTLQLLLPRPAADLNASFSLREFPEAPLTPLLLAVIAKAEPEAIRLLVQSGARIDGADAVDDAGSVARKTAPLRLAVLLQRLPQAEALLALGADPQPQDAPGGMTLWQELSPKAATLTPEALDPWVRLLLAHGCPVDLADGRGRTGLMHAARFNSLALARALLEHGARTDLRDYEGQSALGAAMQGGHQDMVDLLLVHGALP
ncbi:ankyrin repeat domain-containing protein [Mitsuaria sp. WAJ17]|uniref:ankyrin repeat domain-containing protein n=1 Tax=Mitsuaria sp. WAJ17 TaxID=2761452 RepID=UPI00160171A1|nr:ankyrin repeat domain-containing protein [Mitsuaria sp. WAJ17]MBB2488080.1 ankyrin repeat domain-containing protein [Mitsuaria sp. WAJ17]